MASSLDHNQLPNIYSGATAAPPPTPSSQTNHLSTSATADALSKLLHRLPPNLSLPTRRSPSVIPPPTISFSESPNPDHLLSAASEIGFFQLTDHKISSHLALSAESESAALFDLPAEKKESLFTKNWPLGFKGDGDEESDGSGDSLCFDSRLCLPVSAEISLHSLTEFVLEMESLGLKIVEFLFRAIGFENPIGEDRTGFRSLVWISEGCRSTEPAMAGGFYPYIIGLQYQSRNQRCCLLGDSGWVAAAAAAESVMVSIGDIAQVWSNGKLKKMRGRPVPMASSVANTSGTNPRTISLSLLITLPVDNQVSPLLLSTNENSNEEQFISVCDKKEEDDGDNNDERKEKAVFHSFNFEEYAWRVYHDRCFLLKDPLNRYRI